MLFYRILSTKLGHFLLDFFSFGIYVKDLRPKTYNKRQNVRKLRPFIVAVTIDTESGYVDGDERRMWQKYKPEAFIGFYKGVENWRNLFNEYRIKATFLVSTQCFAAKGKELKKILNQLNSLVKNEHEIGLHIHPDSDFAVQRFLNKSFKYTSAKFYDYKAKKQILSASKTLLIKNIKSLKNNLVSFRWGNWGLDTESVKILQELNFRIDTTATPGIKGHLNDEMFYDWSKINLHYPWFLSTKNYLDIKSQNSEVLELPIATFSFFCLKLRADPVNLRLLTKAFDYYYKNVMRDKNPFVFVLISHSSEATYIDGGKTKVVNTMEEFIKHAMKFQDVKFMTLKQARLLLNC